MAEVSSSIFESFLRQVEDYSPAIESVEVGYVTEVGDGIARVTGLNNIRFSELVRFSNGVAGIAFN
ncbi:partial ATP synthase subunit alpha, partial [Planctomycetaceae bacterium]